MRRITLIIIIALVAAAALSAPLLCGDDCGTPKPGGGFKYKSGAETFPYHFIPYPKGTPL